MTVNIVFEQKDLAVARVSNVLKQSNFEQARQQIFEHIQQQGRLAVLVLIEADFTGLEADNDWHDNDDDAFIQQNIDHLAIVGQPHLAEDAVLFLLGGLVSFPIKYFSVEHEALARAWLLAHEA
jgi:hypothetical protein